MAATLRTREHLQRLTVPTRVQDIDEVSADAVLDAVRRGELIRLGPGVVMHNNDGTHPQDLMTLVKAAQLRWPKAVASHATAAQIHGIPYFAAPEATVNLHLSAPNAAGVFGTIAVHWHKLREDEWQSMDGIAITTPLRTSLDVALASSRAWAVAAFDSAARSIIGDEAGVNAPLASGYPDHALRLAVREEHRCGLALAQISNAVRNAKGRHGIANARSALELVDPRSESALESLSRVAIEDSHLPNPQIAFPIDLPWTTYWADFAWPRLRVIGEADGLGKYADPTAMPRQIARQRELEDAGWTVVRWQWSDTFPHPDAMLNRIGAALRSRQ